LYDLRSVDRRRNGSKPTSTSSHLNQPLHCYLLCFPSPRSLSTLLHADFRLSLPELFSSETFQADFFAQSPINSIWIFRKASTSTGQAPRVCVCAHVPPPQPDRCCLCCRFCLCFPTTVLVVVSSAAACGFQLLQSPIRAGYARSLLGSSRIDLDLTGTRVLLHTRPRHTHW